MCKCGKGGVSHVAWGLVLIGALNWGLVGIFDFNLVNWLLGNWPMVERVVYILVGIAAVYGLVTVCRCCMKGAGASGCGCNGGACGAKGMGGACPMCGKSPCMCGKKDGAMNGQNQMK